MVHVPNNFYLQSYEQVPECFLQTFFKGLSGHADCEGNLVFCRPSSLLVLQESNFLNV